MFGFVPIANLHDGTNPSLKRGRTVRMAILRAKVSIKGTRTLLQHCFGPDALPLEKQEREGVPGHNPNEWKKTMMVNSEGKMYIPGTYVFSCIKNGAVYTSSGRGTFQKKVVATLQVEDELIVLENRKFLGDKETPRVNGTAPTDSKMLVFISVVGVKIGLARHIRYRLAAKSNWKCSFTINWDNTVVPRQTMEAIIRDAGKYAGLGDGLKIGCGRFDLVSFEILEKEKKEESGKESSSNGRLKSKLSAFADA